MQYRFYDSTGKNQGGVTYFTFKLHKVEDFSRLILNTLTLYGPQTGTSSSAVYLNVFNRETNQYVGSSTNSAITTVEQATTWQFENLSLKMDTKYFITCTAEPSGSLSNLTSLRMRLWPSTDSDSFICSSASGYPSTSMSFYPEMIFDGEGVDHKGSVKVGAGYYNADGSNKIIFENPVEKAIQEIGGNKGLKNNVVLTLDNSGVSSFVLQGVEAEAPTGYKITKTLDTPVYLKDYKVFGTEPKEGLDVSLTRSSLNCTIIGSPAISSDFVANNFSASSYLSTPNMLPNTAQDVELFFHFITGSSSGQLEELFMLGSGSASGSLYIQLNATRSERPVIVGYNNAGYVEATLIPSTNNSTEYWIRVLYSNTTNKVIAEYSTDGIHYNRTIENSFSMSFLKNAAPTIGGNGVERFVFKGSVYLQDSYIKINEQEWWRGASKPSIEVTKGSIYVGESEGYLSLQGSTNSFYPEDISIHPEDFEAYRPVFVQPEFDSATTYGVVTDSRNNAGQEGWRVFQNTSSCYEPLKEGGWWKWELPEPMTLIQGESSITITGYRYYATRDIRFFADVNKTIPITAQTTVNSSALQIVNIPVTNTVTTSVIYLDVGPSSNWSPFTTFTFNNCYIKGICKTSYLSLANPEGMTKLIATGMKNPTKEYTGSVVTPASLEKKVTLSSDLSIIISVEEA